MSMRRSMLSFACTAAVSVGGWLVATTALAAPPPPPPSEGDGAAGTRPTSAGVRTSPPPPPSSTGSSSAGSGASGASDPFVDQRTPSEDLTRAWGYSSGGATEPNYVRPARETGVDIQINPIGFYQGVTIDGDNLPPFAPEQLGGPAVMTWTGFEGEQGSRGSHVFFQLSAAVDHHMVQQPELITVRLPNTSVNVKNNMRRLDTSYFRTPVTSVQIKRDGADTVIELGLRRPATPTVSMKEGANGYKLLVIEFSVRAEASGEPPPAPPPAGDAPQS